MSLLENILRSLKKLFRVKKPRRKTFRPTKNKSTLKRKSVRASRVTRPKTKVSTYKKSRSQIRTSPVRKIQPKTRSEKKLRVKSDQDSNVSSSILVGEVTHYFSKIKVIVIKVTCAELKVGETIHFKGKTTNFSQKLISMQIESVDVKSARKGKLVGIKVSREAWVGDLVYKSR